MRVSYQIIRIINSFLILLFVYPCLSFGNESIERIDSAAVVWVMDFYQAECDFWSLSNRENVAYYNRKFQTQCIHIFQIGKQEYDSVIVMIYYIGVGVSDVGFDKLLIQKKYKDNDSKFELIWDNPMDIDQVINIMDFFKIYKGFPKSVQLECIEIVTYIYKYAKLKYGPR